MFRRTLASMFCLLVLFSLSAVAEESASPMVLRATAISVKPSGMDAIEAMAKAYVAANRQLETERYFTTWRQVAGKPNQLMFIRSYPNFAAMDEPPMDPLAKALGLEKAQEIKAAWEAVETVQSGIWMHNPTMSAGMPAEGAPKQAFWLQATVAAGQEEAYMAYLAKVAEATRTVLPDYNYQTFAPVAGEPQMWVFAIDMTWAAMDQGPGMTIPQRLEKAYGAKEAKRLLAVRERAVTSYSRVIAKPDPELSYWPEAALASR